MAQKPPPDDADIILVLTSLDPAFGTEQLASWVTDTVMILCPRGINLTRLRVGREILERRESPSLRHPPRLRSGGRQFRCSQFCRTPVDTGGIVGGVVEIEGW